MRFTDALDRAAEEIKRPSNMPIGHYIWQVIKHPEVTTFKDQDGNEGDRIDFVCQCVSPTDDVDPDELSAYGDVTKVQLRKTFFVSDGAVDKVAYEKGMYRFKQFACVALGQPETSTVSELLANAQGCRFLGELTLRPDKENPEVMYDNLGATAPEA